MSAFVRISAVLVGMANLAAYLYVGSSEALIGDAEGAIVIVLVGYYALRRRRWPLDR